MTWSEISGTIPNPHSRTLITVYQAGTFKFKYVGKDTRGCADRDNKHNKKASDEYWNSPPLFRGISPISPLLRRRELNNCQHSTTVVGRGLPERMAIHAKIMDHIMERIRSLTLARRRGGKQAAAASLVAVFYLVMILRQGRRPEVVCRRNGHNIRVLRVLAAVIDRPYYPSWLTPNSHVNGLLGFAKTGPKVAKTRELLRTWGKQLRFERYSIYCKRYTSYRYNER